MSTRVSPSGAKGSPAQSLSDLYEEDETAWLEAMARLAAEHRHEEEFDFEHLSEFLGDMARRDRREVLSRLEGLLMHLLKRDHQPERRTGSWDETIVNQRIRLIEMFESGTLRNHGRDVFDKAYRNAVHRAAAETKLDVAVFPEVCPYSFEQALELEEE